MGSCVYSVEEEVKLLPFLEGKFPDMSRTRIKQMLRSEIVINGRWVSQYDYQLHPGMEVERVVKSFSSKVEPKGVTIVYEDRYLFVVEKREGLLSSSTDIKDRTVVSELNGYLERKHEKCRAHVVHRLDRDTSGLMIVSKSKEVSRIFEHNWRDIVTDRAYVAVVWGSCEKKEDTIVSWLTDGPFCVLSSPVDNGGKKAVTNYRVVLSNGKFSLLELHLDTGRRNQIRVHMRELQHPVVHDPMYGYENDAAPIDRLALHAFRLCFVHPITQKQMDFETSYPSSFLRLVGRERER